jgi:hypothetical protein
VTDHWTEAFGATPAETILTPEFQKQIPEASTAAGPNSIWLEPEPSGKRLNAVLSADRRSAALRLALQLPAVNGGRG